jgi:hypothetical protein
MSATATIRRRLEILAEMGVEFIADERAGSLSDRNRYAPPFHDRLVTGELSPAGYGPSTAAGWQSAWEDYHLSRAGGGLWDPEREPRRATSPPVPSGPRSFAEWVHLHGHEWPPKHLQIITWHLDRRRPHVIAKALGMTRRAVEDVILGGMRAYMAATGT